VPPPEPLSPLLRPDWLPEELRSLLLEEYSEPLDAAEELSEEPPDDPGGCWVVAHTGM
jgi:hypothetical protein